MTTPDSAHPHVHRPSVRLATAADAHAVATLLRRAFEDDPVVQWIMPDPALRDRHLPGLYRGLIAHPITEGSVWVAPGGPDESIAAAGTWVAPGSWPVPVRHQLGIVLPSLGGMRGNVRRGISLISRMERRHRAETRPHWYLEILGSDPEARGRGFGAAVLEPVLARCDHEGLGAYLESSKEQNLPYYERFGWRVVEEIQPGEGAPRLWVMWRDPA